MILFPLAACNPYWGGVPLGMEGFMGAPFMGNMGNMPYMGYNPGPFDVPFGGIIPRDPFAGQGYMMPVVQPQRDLAEIALGSSQAPPFMSREEFEARKADLRRKREGGVKDMEYFNDGESVREMSNNGDISSMKAKSVCVFYGPSLLPFIFICRQLSSVVIVHVARKRDFSFWFWKKKMCSVAGVIAYPSSHGVLRSDFGFQDLFSSMGLLSSYYKSLERVTVKVHMLRIGLLQGEWKCQVLKLEHWRVLSLQRVLLLMFQQFGMTETGKGTRALLCVVTSPEMMLNDRFSLSFCFCGESYN